MIEIADQEFEELINQAMEELPQEYIRNMDNVAVTFEDEPSPEQRQKLHLRGDQSLFGLYEGVPRNRRGGNYMAPPDKITLFKKPITQFAHTMQELKEQVKRTLWHEIAHHYGLEHNRIYELQRKPKPDK